MDESQRAGAERRASQKDKAKVRRWMDWFALTDVVTKFTGTKHHTGNGALQTSAGNLGYSKGTIGILVEICFHLPHPYVRTTQ